MISRSTVQRVANIKKTSAELQDMHQRMKICSEDGYIGGKPNPDHWVDLIDNNRDFRN